MMDNTKLNKPSVILSIDFEMRWGVHDLYGLDFDGYRRNLENCRPAVVSTLNLLAERNLKATWASVGALGLNDWNEYFSFAPPPPAYKNPSLSVRKEYADMDPDGRLHFAPDLIRQIIQAEGQELGSHSFSHLYFREPGVTAADFMADMNAVEQLWTTRYGVTPVSLVFPRNQSAFLNQLNNTSIDVWRGVEPAWFYDCTSLKSNTLFPRMLRLVDSINPWVNRSSQFEGGISRASIFVRFGLPESLWRIQLKRIKNELANLSDDQVLHLWWHPHNLGFDLEKGVVRLTQVLDLIANECESNNVVSLTMRECLHNNR